MRAAREQGKTACGNIQLCVGLEASKEGVTHAIGQKRVERVPTQRGEGKREIEEATEDPEGGEMR